jgi:hypothetical protein
MRVNNKRLILLFIYFAIMSHLAAQDTFYGYSSLSTINTNARGIGNTTLKLYQQRSYIDSAQKASIVKRLLNKNILGIDLVEKIYIPISPKNAKWQWQANIGGRYHLNTSFGASAAKLALHGNSRYAGKTIALGNVSFQSLSWAQVGVGFRHQGTKLYTAVNLNILGGLNCDQFEATSNRLYTQEDGEYIDLDFNAKLKHASAGASLFAGAGLSLDYRASYKLNKSNSIYLLLNDVGFMRWSKNISQYQIDTSFKFEGLVINNLRNVTSDSFSTHLVDSFKQVLAYHHSTNPFTSVLPAMLLLEYRYVWPSGDRLNMGFRHQFLCQHILSPFVAYSHYFGSSKNQEWTTRISVLGYGDIDLDIGIGFTSKHWRGKLMVNGVESFIAPAANAGAGLNLLLGYIINSNK